MMKKMAIAALGLSMCSAVSRAGDGVVALQTADPSCRDDSGDIYVDCGNGTVTDNRTGLVWLANADCLGAPDWYTAMEFAAGLADLPASDPDDCGLSDGSSPGEWRLPSVDEWEAMVDDALGQGRGPDCIASPPTITNDTGGDCWAIGPTSFSDVVESFYWSSTTAVNSPTIAWGVDLGHGGVFGEGKADPHLIWPVRGGQ